MESCIPLFQIIIPDMEKAATINLEPQSVTQKRAAQIIAKVWEAEATNRIGP